jgi:DNA-binding GntR family transcriptional regulator
MPRADLKSVAYRHIRRKLLTRDFRPGGRGLSDRTLARELGISRTPVREAVAQLEQEGLLRQVAGSGTYPRVPSREEIEELFDLREMCECYAAVRAAQHPRASALANMERGVQRGFAAARHVREHAGETWTSMLDTLIDADFIFHDALLACGTVSIARIVNACHLLTISFEFSHPLVPPHDQLIPATKRTAREHEQILALIRAGEGERARQLLSIHLRRGRDSTLDAWDRRRRQPRNDSPRVAGGLARRFSRTPIKTASKLAGYTKNPHKERTR